MIIMLMKNHYPSLKLGYAKVCQQDDDSQLSIRISLRKSKIKVFLIDIPSTSLFS